MQTKSEPHLVVSMSWSQLDALTHRHLLYPLYAISFRKLYVLSKTIFVP